MAQFLLLNTIIIKDSFDSRLYDELLLFDEVSLGKCTLKLKPCIQCEMILRVFLCF